MVKERFCEFPEAINACGEIDDGTKDFYKEVVMRLNELRRAKVRYDYVIFSFILRYLPGFARESYQKEVERLKGIIKELEDENNFYADVLSKNQIKNLYEKKRASRK